jgi:ADP-ribose pyrophosphatase YjhB (NUDIX family)
VKKLPKQRNPYLATDIILRYGLGIVVIERKNPPIGLALPGGFHEWGLDVFENAKKEAKEETNLDLVVHGTLGIYSEPDRDPRGHVVSVVVYGEGRGILKAGDDAKTTRVITRKEFEKNLFDSANFVFDHEDIIFRYFDTVHPYAR